MIKHASEALLLCVGLVMGCQSSSPGQQQKGSSAGLPPTTTTAATEVAGFDRNSYPGDDQLANLHRQFSFSGFWLNNPPGARSNSWTGKRKLLREAGFGFLVLWNGRLEAEIARVHVTAETLGRNDAAAAIGAARREGFLPGTILFLDQEEGGRLLPEQAAYFFSWTEAVAASPYRPGAYLSGQPAPDGTGPDGRPATITTAQDVQNQVGSRKLHSVALWVAQDACPPAPGCTAQPPHLRDSGTLDAIAWQYAQSPRRSAQTRSCGRTYGADGGCYAGGSTSLPVDLDVAASSDPSHGR